MKYFLFVSSSCVAIYCCYADDVISTELYIFYCVVPSLYQLFIFTPFCFTLLFAFSQDSRPRPAILLHDINKNYSKYIPNDLRYACRGGQALFLRAVIP